MVKVEITGNTVRFDVQGLHQLWAFQTHLEVPLDHIRRVYQDAGFTRGWFQGLRAPGTNIPGLVTAGTYYYDHLRIFWDVSNKARAVIFDLQDEPYDRLVVEVENPLAVLQQFEAQGISAI